MMLLAHGALGICPLELASLVVGGAGWLWLARVQLAWWCRTFIRRVHGVSR